MRCQSALYKDMVRVISMLFHNPVIVEDLYCLDNGRSSLDPVVLFKMVFRNTFTSQNSKRNQDECSIQVASGIFNA